MAMMARRFVYGIWEMAPRWFRALIAGLAERSLPLIFAKGRKVTYGKTSFRVEVSHLGELRRAQEFSYKEGAFTQSVYESIQRQPVIYDIGAHVGYYVLLAALGNPDAKVVALEPEASNYSALQRNLRNNYVRNVVTKNVAVGEDNSELFFEDTNLEKRSGGGSHRLSDTGQGSRVKVVRLDDFIIAERLPAPSIILMDIEGGELAALKGMENTLRRYSPTLFIEVHADLLEKHGDSVALLDEKLTGLGYSKVILRQPEGIPGEHRQTHVRYQSLTATTEA